MKELIYHRLLLPAVERNADRTCAVNASNGFTTTYAQHLDRVGRLIGGLRSLGVGRGDRFAVMTLNSPEYLELYHAAYLGGGVVNPLNLRFAAKELAYVLRDSDTKVCFVDAWFAPLIDSVKAEAGLEHVVLVGGGADTAPHTVTYDDLIASSTPTIPDAGDETDPVVLMYTGGTTGVSKGATLTHGNIVANTLQCDAWFQPALGKLDGQANMVVALPLYHIFALTVCGMVGMRLGAMCVLIVNPRDIGQFIKDMSKQHISMLPAVNTLFNALMNHPDFKKMDWSHLKVSMGGGMAVQAPVAERWYQLTGCSIVEGYGLSETSPVVTANLIDSTKFTGTIGLPLPSTEIAILDDDGKALPIGSSGEIGIRGPQVMRGYWNRPDETARSMTADGFFKTGDVGIMDERGYTKIVDRKKDMILVSGFNVYPNEVEEVIAGCPGVSEVAAIGVPDEHSGEAVKVFVVRKDPSLTEADIKKFAEQGLTGYKKPRHIEFRDDLPKTNVGKILRRALRNEELEKLPKTP